jgi:hypothetical protein
MTEVFPMIPAPARLLWIIAGLIVAIMIVVLLLLFASARGARDARFEVSDAGLRIRGDIYGRLVPASAIRGAEARIVDVDATSDLTPSSRTAGTAIPGYQSGWYRLRNGEKALLYLTERGRAVYVPTTVGYSLLLSPKDPERFLDRLRAIAR